MIQLTDAVLAIKSDAQVSISGEDVTTIVWHDDNPTNISNTIYDSCINDTDYITYANEHFI